MKKLTALLCLAALLLSLCACGAKTTAATTAAASETTEAPTETTAEAVEVRLAAMTGPTGIGMAKLFHDAEAGEKNYTVTIKGAADELTPMLLQGLVDIAAVPANLASVLYNKTEGGVEALAVNVLGVLYVCELNGETVKTVADLKGQTVYATGKGSVPEYFLRYVLKENGIDPDTEVTFEWKSEPAEVVAAMNAQQSGICMLPQPYVIAAKGQLGEGFRVALSVSKEWDALENGTQCTTACIIVRKEFAQSHPAAVEAFLKDYAESAEFANANPVEAGQYCADFGIVAKAQVAEKAIPQCNIVCITGAAMKNALGGCLNVLFGENPKAVGGAMPGDDFYYGA